MMAKIRVERHPQARRQSPVELDETGAARRGAKLRAKRVMTLQRNVRFGKERPRVRRW